MSGFHIRWRAFVGRGPDHEPVTIESDTRLGTIDLLAEHLRRELPDLGTGEAHYLKIMIGPYNAIDG